MSYMKASMWWCYSCKTSFELSLTKLKEAGKSESEARCRVCGSIDVIRRPMKQEATQ